MQVRGAGIGTSPPKQQHDRTLPTMHTVTLQIDLCFSPFSFFWFRKQTTDIDTCMSFPQAWSLFSKACVCFILKTLWAREVSLPAFGFLVEEERIELMPTCTSIQQFHSSSTQLWWFGFSLLFEKSSSHKGLKNVKGPQKLEEVHSSPFFSAELSWQSRTECVSKPTLYRLFHGRGFVWTT